MKKCNVCGELKEPEFFYRDKNMPDSLRKNCKVCKNKQVSGWRAKNKTEWNAYMRKHRAEHPDSEKTRERNISRKLKSLYGITLDRKKAMFADQGGLCMICSKNMVDLTHAYIDHNHSTNKVRDLLCQPCNTYIGYILEDPATARKIETYLAKHA